MSYFICASAYGNIFKNHPDLLEKVYDLMEDENCDLAELLLTALEILKKSNAMPTFEQLWKSIDTSNEYREQGNKAYVAGAYSKALMYYNKALAQAPMNTKSMLLAYSNRSALFHKTKNYTASLRDIEVCLKLGCPNDILEKLTKRRTNCMHNLWTETTRYGKFSNTFFSLEGKHHPQVPCITDDVEISIDPDTQLPKITAAKNIKIGTVVAVETAFTTLLDSVNQYLVCYYCNRMSLNLIPCPNCTNVLFCDIECKNLCMKERHSVECKMMEVLYFSGMYPSLTFQTVIKIKLMCSTWKEFIRASHNIGTERMKNSTIEQIFDGTYKFSMLNFAELRDIRLGAMFNYTFMAAIFVHELTKQSFFFPHETEEREKALKAIARMTLGLLLKFYNRIDLSDVVEDRMERDNYGLPDQNHGYFAFASKLRHDCNSNLECFALNNKVALVAIHPIKKGQELTISFSNHAYYTTYCPLIEPHNERARLLYQFGQICRCLICTKTHTVTKSLDKTQRRKYLKFSAHFEYDEDYLITQGDAAFKTVCDLMTSLHGLLGTKEHLAVYTWFRALIAVYQVLATKNFGPYDKEHIVFETEKDGQGERKIVNHFFA